MHLLLSILAIAFIVFGIVLLFSNQRGTLLAAVICIGAGVYSYDISSFIPLFVGFGLLWVLRLLGIEKR